MKKGILIFSIVIIVIVLVAVGYFFFFKKIAKPIVWDGAYTMTGSLPCTGNFPNLTAIPMNTTFTVSSNKILEPTVGKSYDIDKDGKATETIEQTQNGVTAKVKADYQFSKEGDVYKFTANGVMDMSTTKDGKILSSTCTGTVTGVKQ